MKNIVFVIEDFRFGGVEISLINLLNNIDFEKKDYNVVVLTYGTETDVLSKLNKNNRIKVKNVNNNCIVHMRKVFEKIFGKSKTEVFFNKITRYLVIRDIEKNKYDVVIRYHHASIKTLFRHLKKRDNQKFVAWYHHENDYTGYFLGEENVKACDKVVVVADGNKQNIEKRMPYLADKLYVVENLIPYEEIKQMSEYGEKEFDDNSFNILTVARIDSQKGIDLAIESFLTVRKKIKNCKWYVIGNVAEDRRDYGDRVERIIKEYGLQGEFVLLGGKSNPYTYMRQCDLYIQPSQWESFGITMAEAQVCGCVVVATDTVGSRLLIDNGKTGIICDYSCEELSKTILDLYKSSKKMAEIRENVKEISFEEKNKKVMKKFYDLVDG